MNSIVSDCVPSQRVIDSAVLKTLAELTFTKENWATSPVCAEGGRLTVTVYDRKGDEKNK